MEQVLNAVFLLLTVSGFLHQEVNAACGYESCSVPKEGMINVHLVPHSHDDVGFTKTLDQFYYGSRNFVRQAGVQYILDSVTSVLSKDPSKKFIYAETAFFWKWWVEQDQEMKDKFRTLVNNGQLQFVGGSWTQQDEAITNYQNNIDQYTWGLRKLNDTFGECGRPRVAWQVDPFGHSKDTASMLARMSYDGVFFGRFDYQDRIRRQLTQEMEMVWESSESLGTASDLFTGLLYISYSAPPGFCVDLICEDYIQPYVDDPASPDYNVLEKTLFFIEYARVQAAFYKTNNILITIGGDFTYQGAHMNYKNLDKLIRYGNERQQHGSNVNIFYSTPSCYLKSLHDSNMTWPVKTDDFFPYSSDEHSYWTGYYTSRPSLKYLDRKGNNFLQVCKQLSVLGGLGDSPSLDSLREVMGVMQHHDAVTGTCKENVANDYVRLLDRSITRCLNVTEQALNLLMRNENQELPQLSVQHCLLRNISQCAASSADTFILTLYNPLSRTASQYVRLPVPGNMYSVKDAAGVEVTHQIVPIPESIQNMRGRSSNTTLELVFKSTDIPPVGFKSYYVSKLAKTIDTPAESIRAATEDVFIGDDDFQLKINGTTGLLESVDSGGIVYPLQQNFYLYTGVVGDNSSPDNKSAGTYIFRPVETAPEPHKEEANITVFRGEIMDEVHQTFSNWISQVIRYYKTEKIVEMEWLVGPIPTEDGIGKEVITRYTTDIKSNGTWYTDSNSREIVQRYRDHRPSWELEVTEPVAGNYYPITSNIAIRDEQNGFAVVTDRSQGGGSLNDGELEIMLHRRLLADDDRGLDEPLDELAYGVGVVARGRHWLVVGSAEDDVTPSIIRPLVQQNTLDSWLFLSEATDVTYETWQQTYTTEFSGVVNDLPANINVLTLEPWKDNTLLLRLEHIYAVEEDQILSVPTVVDLSAILINFDVLSAKETNLAANQWLDEVEKLKWNKENGIVEEIKREEMEGPFEVILNPMEIKTFVLEVVPRR